MSITKKILLLLLPALLSACSSGGPPGERQMSDAIRSKLLFDIRRQMQNASADIVIDGLQSKDCIENAGQWRCRVEADLVAKHPQHGEMEDRIKGDVTFTKTEGKWTAEMD